MYGSVTVGEKNPKSMWWNDVVKAAFKRKELAWKVLGARDEDAIEVVWKFSKKKRKRLKGVHIRAK